MKDSLNLKSVGFAKTPYIKLDQCPPNGWVSENLSTIIIHEEYLPCLEKMQHGHHIHVLWWFGKANRSIYSDFPKDSIDKYGCFVMRSPNRPNPIALSLCKVIEVRNNSIVVKGLECLNKSLIIDIKIAINFESIIL